MISSIELAKICGVSQGTVDRALHNRKGISEKTKKKVLKAAERYGYRPNPVASELLRGTSCIVGAIVPAVNSPFYMDFMRFIRLELEKQGLKLYLTTASSEKDFIETLEDFAFRKTKAVVVVPPVDNIEIPENVSRIMPVVSLIGPCKGSNAIFLNADEHQTSHEAVSYLWNKGHKNILHVTYEGDYCSIIDRRDGYVEKMKELGGKPSVLAPLNEEQLVAKVKNENITAVYCNNDWLALAVIRNLQQNGYRVPEDVSVIGVDNSPTFTALYEDITTVEFPMHELAIACSQWITEKSLTSINFALKVIERKTVKAV